MSEPDLIVLWEADDGYVGGSRPHTVIVPGEELAECDTLALREQLIDEYVQGDFAEKVSWVITSIRPKDVRS